MTLICRVGFARLVCSNFSNRLCKVPRNHNVLQAASLTSVSDRVERNKPPPFPYWRKQFSMIDHLREPVMERFDDNSKIVVVDGPPDLGKVQLCESLAEEFDLLYMPAPTFDELYINENGLDLRELNKHLDPDDHYFDLSTLHQHPDHPKLLTVQMHYFHMRLEQYLNAMLHLLTTGQGIVLNRSVYSDIAFAKAMFESGYINKEDYSYYRSFYDIIYKKVLRPHVIVYLDAPVNVVQNKLKQNSDPIEANSKALTETFLRHLETAYKTELLKPIMSHSSVLSFDGSKGADHKSIKMELEQLDLDTCEVEGKLADWIFDTRDDVRSTVLKCWSKHHYFHALPSIIKDVPSSLFRTPDTYIEREHVREKLFGRKYPTDTYKGLVGVHWSMWTFLHTPTLVRETPRDFMYRKTDAAK